MSGTVPSRTGSMLIFLGAGLALTAIVARESVPAGILIAVIYLGTAYSLYVPTTDHEREDHK